MPAVRNILFIMCDQLRWDYLSCSGHPHLKTPNIDRLASKGVRFDRAFVNAPVCGPSRMSFYTGRTVFSHGATWNYVPLPIGELTIGDYLIAEGVRVAIAGKTHIRQDAAGLARQGLTNTTDLALIVSEGGFEAWEKDDGVHPPNIDQRGLAYNTWLKGLGYDGDHPWDSWANAAAGPNGEVLSGWALRNSVYPARIKEEHSETPYITNRGLEFMKECGDKPWLLHLSYIKPHWPYIAPAPYHAMYGAEHVVPAVKNERERVSPHPVYEAFMRMEIGQSFAREDVRQAVIPAYMGLIHQIDDHLGRVFDYLESSGRMKDTMIVFASDHGDYLGDHWLGEKELFHEPSVRVPLIIYDPDPAADATRGTVTDKLVEAIDLVPTFLDVYEAKAPRHRLEGRSLLPLIRGPQPLEWRDSVFCELDYAFYEARELTEKGANDARAYMLRTERWKYIHYKGFAPQLFDLKEDPDELVDLGMSQAHDGVRREMHGRLLERLTDRRNRITVDDEWVLGARARESKVGVIIGRW